MWSASSIAVTSTSPSEHSPCRMRSSSRPGVATSDVDAAAQRRDLPAHRRAAVDREHADAERLAERSERVLHLPGQLAGRDQHQAARAYRRGGRCCR